MKSILIKSNSSCNDRHQVVNSSEILHVRDGKEMLLKTQRTKQSIITFKKKLLVSTLIQFPTPIFKCPYRQTCFLVHNKEIQKVRVFWIPNNFIHEAMADTKRLLCFFSQCKKLSQWNKQAANGTCFEFGVGSGAGKQSSSIRTEHGISQMCYIRNKPEFCKYMHDLYNPIEEKITLCLEKLFPDVFDRKKLLDGYISLDEVGKVILSGMNDVQKGLPYLQRALRLNGHTETSSPWLKTKSSEGGSTLHVDKCDCNHLDGNIIMYLNPMEASFNGTNLLVFSSPTGGKSVEIPTMVPGYACVVVLQSSKCLHGSAFPEPPFKSDTFSSEGKMAVRTVLYSLKNVIYHVEHLSKDIYNGMAKWKHAIDGIDVVSRWRHVTVYNRVCDSLNQYFREHIFKNIE